MTNLLFPHQQLLSDRFLQTDLGQLYLSIPFDQLAATILIPKHEQSGRDCKPWLDVKGGIALQFLKRYTDCASVIVQFRWPKRLLHRHYTGICWTNL